MPWACCFGFFDKSVSLPRNNDMCSIWLCNVGIVDSLNYRHGSSSLRIGWDRRLSILFNISHGYLCFKKLRKILLRYKGDPGMSKPPLRLNDSITLSGLHWQALLKPQSGSFDLTHLGCILIHQSLCASRSHSCYWKLIYTALELFVLMILSSCRLRFSRRAMPSLEDLREQWNHLYRTQLPALAKAKDAAQPKWPVQLDHCFARIILDNAVGKDRPWNQVLKSPAYKNMSREQFLKISL